MRRSTLLAAGLGLGVLALVLLAYLARRPPATSEPALAATPPQEEPPAPPLQSPASPSAVMAPPRASAPDVSPGPALEVSPDPAPSFPAPAPDQVRPRPEQQPATPAELRAQKQASLELIQRSIDRLESERQRAERAGDGETARRSEIRIKRLRARSEALREELAVPASATEALPVPGTASPGAP